jgi:AcrR family transcriptional regulator
MQKKIPPKLRHKRNKLINHARKVFRQYGYKKTTMEDIANETQMGKSSLYYYFKSKTEVYNAVVLHEAVLYRKMVMAAINENDSPYDKLKSYILQRMQTNEVLPNFHQAINDNELREMNFVKRLNTLYDKEEFRLFRNILESGIHAGYFEIPDIKNAAIGIVTAMRGIESTIMLYPDDPAAEQKIDNILKIILYGIVKRNNKIK